MILSIIMKHLIIINEKVLFFSYLKNIEVISKTYRKVKRAVGLSLQQPMKVTMMECLDRITDTKLRTWQTIYRTVLGLRKQ